MIFVGGRSLLGSEICKGEFGRLGRMLRPLLPPGFAFSAESATLAQDRRYYGCPG